MKKFKYLFIVIFLILPMISMIILSEENQKIYSDAKVKEEINTISESGGPGVSNYTITNYVEYDVVINFTITQTNDVGDPYDFYFKFARLNDRQPNNTLTSNCPEYQKSQLLYHNITGYKSGELKQNFHDSFNNTFDEFNATLSNSETATYDARYNITLNAIRFNDIDDGGIGNYDTSDEIFTHYCNGSNSIYNRTDPELIFASNYIVDPSDNPIEKAQKIINNISQYLTYDGSLPAQEKGASWAYDNKRGDCSEYSSLMVTLLRIQKIPARKITGFLISNNPNLRPQKGNSWTFSEGGIYDHGPPGTFAGGTNFLRHAWVEYYVPDVGWIQCDPTWHTGGYNYFNRIDYLRFNEINGDWVFQPPNTNYTEFGSPGIIFDTDSDFNYDFQVTITVTDTDVIPLPAAADDDDDDDKKSKGKNELLEFLLSPIGLLLIVGLVATVVIIIILITRREKEDYIYRPDY